MGNSISERNSSIELLRIVCMIMILNLHAFFIPATLTWGTLSFANIVTIFSESLSICAVNSFVLISGYFSIKWKWRGFLSLIFQVYFFVFLIYFALLLVGVLQFKWSDFFFRANCIRYSYWFVTSYVVMYIVSPILNVFVENASKKQLLYFLIAFYLIETYLCTAGEIFASGYSPLHFVGLYLLGRTINKYPVKKLESVGFSAAMYVIATVCIAILFIGYKIFTSNTKTTFDLPGCYSNPLVVIQSVALFFIFKNLKIKSKVINWCSISILSVYLLHMHPDVKQYYYDHTASLYGLSVFDRFIHLVILFAAIFVVSILIDKLRVLCFSVCWNFGCVVKERIKLKCCHRREDGVVGRQRSEFTE